MPHILVQFPDGSTRRFAIAEGPLRIGRSRESEVFLPDQALSRQHAEIRPRAGEYYLADLGSKNGTLLNQSRIASETILKDKDEIRLGDYVLTFSTSSASAEEEDAPLGTRIFSAKELSAISTKDALNPEELQRQNRILSILTHATRSLVDHRPLPELFELVLKLLFDVVKADRAAILLFEGGPEELVIRASRSREGTPITKVSRSIARRVINERVAVILPDVLEDAAFSAQDSILATGIRSAVCVPLWFTPREGNPDEVIGLIYLDTLRRKHSFDEDDLKVLTALANVAAAKIENVRLLEDSLEKLRMEEDMQRAAEIQRRLLPSVPPVVKGYEVVGSNKPCLTVGGDYFDFMLDEGRVLMVLGDVSGKGTGAALLMTVLRAAVRAHWLVGSMSEAVGRINDTVCQNVPEGKYATFFSARLEVATGQITYVNAGHNAPLLVRADGHVERLVEGGVVLGMFPGAPYAEGVVAFQPGDTLIAFSDGVSETFDPDGNEFGEERLVAAVGAFRGLCAREVEQRVLQEIERFARGAKATDDRTLIVLTKPQVGTPDAAA